MRQRPEINPVLVEEKKKYIAWRESLKKNLTVKDSDTTGYCESFIAGGKNWLYFNYTFYQTVELVDATKIESGFDGQLLIDGADIQLVGDYYPVYVHDFEQTLSEAELATRPVLTVYDPKE